MERKFRTIRKGFDYRRCDDFAVYLNHMARLGWHFKEWRAGLVFEKGEPEEAVYAVEVFTDATEYDTRPEPNTQEFAEYCEAAGWQFIDAKRKFCIFKRLRPDALPIMTDEERFHSIVKASQKDIFYAVFYGFIWVAMRLGDFNMRFERYIFSDTHIVLTAVWLLLLGMALLRLVLFLSWKFRCKKRLDEKKSLFFGKGRQTYANGWYNYLYSGVFLIMLLSLFLEGETWGLVTVLLVIGIINLGSYLIARVRPDAVTNQIIQTVGSMVLLVIVFIVMLGFTVFDDDPKDPQPQPPLTYADMGMDLDLERISHTDRLDGWFGSWTYFNLDYGQEYLYYNVYETEYDWVLEEVWARETEGKVNETRDDCTATWDAQEAFRNNAGNYLVRYENVVWVICPSLKESLTSEQIDAVIAALKEG